MSCPGGGRGGGGGGFGGPAAQFGPPREDISLGTVGRPGGTVRVMSAEDTERALQDAYNALDPKFKASLASHEAQAFLQRMTSHICPGMGIACMSAACRMLGKGAVVQ